VEDFEIEDTFFGLFFVLNLDKQPFLFEFLIMDQGIGIFNLFGLVEVVFVYFIEIAFIEADIDVSNAGSDIHE